MINSLHGPRVLRFPVSVGFVLVSNLSEIVAKTEDPG